MFILNTFDDGSLYKKEGRRKERKLTRSRCKKGVSEEHKKEPLGDIQNKEDFQ